MKDTGWFQKCPGDDSSLKILLKILSNTQRSVHEYCAAYFRFLIFCLPGRPGPVLIYTVLINLVLIYCLC